MEKTQDTQSNIIFELILKKYGTVIVLLLFIFLNILFTKNFFTISSILNILQQASVTALLSVGMTLVASTGNYDLAIGSYVALVGVICALMLRAGIPTFFAVLSCFVVVILFELVAGYIVAYLKIQSIIVTIALQTLVKGVATVITGGNVIQITDKSLLFFGQGRIFGIPFQIILTVVIIALFIFIMSRSVFSRKLSATGDNENAAILVGIKTQRIKMMAFMLCGLLSTFAGLIVTAKIEGADPANIGADFPLSAIAATAIGGTPLTGGKPRIVGTVIGVMIIQLIDTSINMNNIQYSYSLIIKAVIIILSLLFQNSKKD